MTVAGINAGNMDISELSISELEDLKKRAAEEIENQLQKQTKQQLREIGDIAKNNNFTVFEVLKALRDNDSLVFSTDQGAGARKIYYNPKFPLDMYMGIGRKPKWLTEMENSGIDIENYTFEV